MLFTRDLLDEIARDLVAFALAVERHAKTHKGLESAGNVPPPRIDKVDCRFARPPFRKDGHQKPVLALRFDEEAREIGDALSGDGEIFEGPVVVRRQRGSEQDFRLRSARPRKVPGLQPRRAAKDQAPVARQFGFACRLIVLSQIIGAGIEAVGSRCQPAANIVDVGWLAPMKDTVQRHVGNVGERLAGGEEHDVEDDLRILHLKGVKQFGGDGGAELARRADPERSRHLLMHLGHCGGRIVAARPDLPRMAQEFRAGIGQVQLMALAHEQLDTELVFQLPNAVAKGRLRQPMQARCCRNRPCIRHFHETIDH
ncbi:hypothetical protein EMEDMD4_790310 [Sinorhizobium medicae]|uniref:Uncharacterized protein n=1 Tax=Sinorhizobium medicae TaxID=110321 RepID=A0A508XB07_9HYPH|nr:hypothetical protein EMEDMD4_790310 [Sinorhizobium medicae]